MVCSSTPITILIMHYVSIGLVKIFLISNKIGFTYTSVIVDFKELLNGWMHGYMDGWMKGWMEGYRHTMQAYLYSYDNYIWQALIDIRIAYFWNELLIVVNDLIILNIFSFYLNFLLKYTGQNWLRNYCIYITSAWAEIENLKDCLH